MGIRFTKMHGLGNDFVIIDAVYQNNIHLTPNTIAQLSRRDTGIGFDQCLLVEASSAADIDFVYRIFNADGQEVGQCGNGARCLARFVQHYGLTNKQCITVATKTTRMQLRINEDDSVTVDMGKPNLQPIYIPMTLSDQMPLYTLPNIVRPIHAISVGNPHAVMIVDDVTQSPVQELGHLISHHSFFPQQTNVGFMQIVTPNQINLRVYERGCGETQACGSGAVAAMAVGRLFHNLEADVVVSLPGGDLGVSWPNLDGSIYLTGPAVFVYEGELM